MHLLLPTEFSLKFLFIYLFIFFKLKAELWETIQRRCFTERTDKHWKLKVVSLDKAFFKDLQNKKFGKIISVFKTCLLIAKHFRGL